MASSHFAYNIQFSPKAWSQTGSLDLATFQRMRTALKDLATGAAIEGTAGAGELAARALKRAVTVMQPGFIAFCELDHQTRTVTLLEVHRKLPEAE